MGALFANIPKGKGAGILLLLMALATAAAPMSAAQSESSRPEYPWETSIFYTFESLTEDRPSWHRLEALVLRRFNGRSVLVKGIRVRRFQTWDEAVAVGGYLDLWRQSYGHVSLQYAPDAVALADVDFYGEIFQGIGDGWEAAGSYRLRSYPQESVHLAGAALAKYIGKWYLREKSTLVFRAGETGYTQTVSARRYFTPPREFVEVRAGIGRGVALVGPGPSVEFTRTYFASVRLQRFLTPHIGYSVGASHSNIEFYARSGVILGLLVRW